jgi:hypothetical protein
MRWRWPDGLRGDVGRAAASGLEHGRFGLDAMLIAPDGCIVEQDGGCPHGYESPLKAVGLI